MNMKYIFPFFMVVLMLTGFAHAEDRLPPMARQTLHTAQIHMDNERFDEVVSVLRTYMASTDEIIPAPVYIMLGGAHYRNGHAREAYTAFIEGQAVWPRHEMLVRNCAVLCYELDRFKDAGKFFEKAYALTDPLEPLLLFQAGSAYYGGEDFSASSLVMDRLMAPSQQPKKEWVRLAIHAHLQAGHPHKAEKMLHRFLAENPDEGPYWELLAKLHLDREEYEEAAGALEICYRLRDPSQRELERLASLYHYSNAPLMAAATLRRAYCGTTETPQFEKIAFLCASAGRLDDAVQTIARCPYSVERAEKQGRFLYQGRRFDDATTVFQDVLHHESKAGESRFFLAMCAWERRDWKGVKEHLSRLRGNPAFANRLKGPLQIIEDMETVRAELRE
ncbi:tetratricopeptide repeat protein [Pseudodesulfovibrio sp. JC047]|uniref:tetratricopeptide repeat protein n=1 Tax=Pseudodesulfovibrio sp. JC047 TaxID=2683199 RepID=UPI0013D59587|nr:tetratricopeptide repeat protein [Pseudodesulfovibrio sp. JC047]NDV19835.1 tetratricopeptide repeat protein [Pseudodesulfovibrio sp. JC047]